MAFSLQASSEKSYFGKIDRKRGMTAHAESADAIELLDAASSRVLVSVSAPVCICCAAVRTFVYLFLKKYTPGVYIYKLFSGPFLILEYIFPTQHLIAHEIHLYACI